MNLQRIKHLEQTSTEADFMTFEEMIQGWHWCIEFDFMVTTGEIVDEDGRCLCGIRGKDLLIDAGCLDAEV